jgi:hypothetical protein
MELHLALFQATPSGGVRMLGHTDEPNLVESVREHLIDRQISSLRTLGFDREEEDAR